MKNKKRSLRIEQLEPSSDKFGAKKQKKTKTKKHILMLACTILALALAVTAVACTSDSSSSKSSGESSEETVELVYYSVKSDVPSETTTKETTTTEGRTKETTTAPNTSTRPDSGNDFIDENAEYNSSDSTWWIDEETICKYTKRGKKITFEDAKGNQITVNASCEFLANGEEDGEVYAKVLDDSDGSTLKSAGIYILNTITKRTKSQVEEEIAVKQRNSSDTVGFIDDTEVYETETYDEETEYTEWYTEEETETYTEPETETETETESITETETETEPVTVPEPETETVTEAPTE